MTSSNLTFASEEFVAMLLNQIIILSLYMSGNSRLADSYQMNDSRA